MDLDMLLAAVVEREGDQYTAWCPALDVASQGPTVEEAVANLKEAVELYLEDEDVDLEDRSVFLTTIEVGSHGKATSDVRA